MGRDAEAESIYDETVVALESILGASHPRVLWAKGGYAALLAERGKYDRAQTLLEQIVDQLTTRKGWDHPEVSSSLGSLGGVYMSTGQFDKAKAATIEFLAERWLRSDRQHGRVVRSGTRRGIKQSRVCHPTTFAQGLRCNPWAVVERYDGAGGGAGVLGEGTDDAVILCLFDGVARTSRQCG